MKNRANDGNDSNPLLSSDTGVAPTSLQSPDASILDRYTGLSKDLVAAWPTERDLDHIYDLPVRLSTLSYVYLCVPNFAKESREPVSAREILQLPSPGSHPVLIARSLLILGSHLQGTLSSTHLSRQMRDHFSEIMSRAIDTATRLVTTNDNLTASIDGIECIMAEAMLQNHAGKLHRAWQTVHRASAVAQMMGLHRRTRLSSLKVLDPGRKAGYDADRLCFRIVEMDCYLSLTLGFPQSSLETHALTNEALARCEPLDRMARLQCIVAGRIVARQINKVADDPMFIHENEQMLQQTAREMSPQWWLVPDYKPGPNDATAEPFQETARINYQFSHYHLLVRLHMPYMLRSSHEGKNEYSKIAAVNAGRECLARYMAFRKWNPSDFYCRGTDFIAFIAVTVMCIAHIESRSSINEKTQSDTDVGRMLAQSHLSDRGMMERTVEILMRMENDAIACKLARIMQHLLDVEADANTGTEYSAVSVESEGAATECEGGFVNDKSTLQLHIPYFGTINLQRRMVSNPVQRAIPSLHDGSKSTTLNNVLPDELMASSQLPFSGWDNEWSQPPLTTYGNLNLHNNEASFPDLFDPTSDVGLLNDWTLQSINESLFSSLFGELDDGNAVHIMGTSSTQ